MRKLRQSLGPRTHRNGNVEASEARHGDAGDAAAVEEEVKLECLDKVDEAR